MSTVNNEVAQIPGAPLEGDVEFVKVDIIESKSSSVKSTQELNGKKMNC